MGCDPLPAARVTHTTFDMADITPPLSLPKFKGSTVRVSALNAGVLVIPSIILVQPHIHGHEMIEAPLYSFLVENERVGKKALFDLGTMKTWKEKLPQCTSRHCPSYPFPNSDLVVFDFSFIGAVCYFSEWHKSMVLT